MELFENIRLQYAPWGDGSSDIRKVNLISKEIELVLAEDIDEDFAKEVCRRWNAFVETIESS